MSEFDVTPEFDEGEPEVTEEPLVEDETPPEPPEFDVPAGYVVYIGMHPKTREQMKEPYKPGMLLSEGQRPQPPTGARLLYEGPLPADIEEIWGNGKIDASGLPAENTARGLIGCWGIERFRASALHQLAAQEMTREDRMAPVRKAFIEAYRKKQAK